MPRFISKSTGSRISRPNGLALVKKKSSPQSIGRSSILSRRVSSRVSSRKFVYPKNLPFSWKQLGGGIDGESTEDGFGFSVSLSSDGTILAAGAPVNDGNGEDSGHVRVFKWNGATWEQLGSDIDGESAQDYSGYSVSLSSDGTILAVGAIQQNDDNGNNSGRVQVFRWDGTTWEQLGGNIDGEGNGDEFGTSVSLSSDGTILAAGAPKNDGNGINSGHVRVFKWNGTAWEQLGGDIDGESARDYSGSVSLSSDGTILAVGAPFNNDNGNDSGHVRVFRLNGTAWEQLGGDIDGESGVDEFGWSVSLNSDGTILAAGAKGGASESGTGHVRVFKWNGATWKQLGGNIDGIDGDATNYDFGFSVSLSSDGTILAVGYKLYDVNGEETRNGRVQIFKWNGTAWEQLGGTINSESAEDGFGFSVSLSSDGTILAAGAITFSVTTNNGFTPFKNNSVRVFKWKQ